MPTAPAAPDLFTSTTGCLRMRSSGPTRGRIVRSARPPGGNGLTTVMGRVGCGTGRHLEGLATTIAECWGVDYLESNVAYARAVRPTLVIRQGDMRAVRLGRTFDVVTCFGNALSYALTDADLGRTVGTFAVHAHAGTLLIVDVLNARCYLEGDGSSSRRRRCRCTRWTGRRDGSGARGPGTSPASRTSRTTRNSGWWIPGSSAGSWRTEDSKCAGSTTTASSRNRISAAR